MKICVLGWYGTETIGDRAILAGLLSIFHKTFSMFELSLGSLYPFFSERTLCEDAAFYQKMIGRTIDIELFDSMNKGSLKQQIKKADLVIMGGGPLMDLWALHMIEYAFWFAKKKKKKTALLGCGIGPLFQDEFKSLVVKIVKNSDIKILRDQQSVLNLAAIYQEQNISISDEEVFYSFDPAVECSVEFDKLVLKKNDEIIAVNLRAFPAEYCLEEKKRSIDESLMAFINALTEKFPKREIRLIPMHYFTVGTDDRYFLNQIHQTLSKKNLNVQNKPFSLYETMEVFQSAFMNIGMRFHSVVLQTILNGNNYILDYTEPQKGKISGFLNDIDIDGFYKTRYLNLQNSNKMLELKAESKKFTVDQEMVQKSLLIYKQNLCKI